MIDEFLKKNADFLKKLSELAYDATVGLVKSYQEKTVTLAKLHAAQFYMKLVQNARKHIALVAVAFFAVVLAAVGLVVVPIAVVLLLELSRAWKLALIGAWGVCVIVIPLSVFFTVFSEKTWLKFSKSRQIMEDIISEG